MNRIAKTTIVGVALLLAACTDKTGTTQILEDAGYTNIVIGGYEWFGGCAKDDTYKTTFEATSQAGHRVKGVVCAGLFLKGATIRIYGRVSK